MNETIYGCWAFVFWGNMLKSEYDNSVIIDVYEKKQHVSNHPNRILSVFNRVNGDRLHHVHFHTAIHVPIKLDGRHVEQHGWDDGT